MKSISKIKSTGKFVFLIVVSVTLYSCASILNPRFQKIRIITDKNCTVTIDGNTPDMKNGKYLAERDARAKQIKISKEGYKDEHISIIQYRKSPYYIMTVVPFTAALFIPPFYDNMIKSKNYIKKLDITNKMIPIPNKSKFSALIDLDTIKIDLNDNNVKLRDFVQYRRYLKNRLRNDPKIGDYSTKNEIKSIYQKRIFSQMLENKKYITNSSKKSNIEINKIHISASITSYCLNHIKVSTQAKTAVQKEFGDFLEVDIGVKWEVFDNKENSLFSFNSQNKSGQFAYYDYQSRKESLQNAINDALEYGFIELVKTKEFNELSEKTMEQNNDYIANNNNLKIDSIEWAEKESNDLISFEEKGDVFYFKKGNMMARAENQSGTIIKNTLLRFINDVPELDLYTQKNFNSGKGYTSSLISCYNDYKLHKDSVKLNQDYYYKFGLITRKEWRWGPSDYMLRVSKPISGEINHIRTTVTKEYVYSGQTTFTVGEHYRFKFVYGNAEYKKGFLLRNLKKAVGNNEEALMHIRKYRHNFIARTSIFTVGLIQLYALIRMVDTDKGPFGLSNKATWIICSPTLVFTNWFNFFPQKYKTKNIKDAVDAYNRDLSKKD